jgi:hypothetical protein
MRRLALALALLLTGCTSAGPNAYLLYAKGNYYYGRMEAKTELLCTPTPRRADLMDYCREAAQTREIIKSVVPIIEAELVKEEPDWAKIMQYLDLVLSLASKAL